jgi:hypothetical protein
MMPLEVPEYLQKNIAQACKTRSNKPTPFLHQTLSRHDGSPIVEGHAKRRKM